MVTSEAAAGQLAGWNTLKIQQETAVLLESGDFQAYVAFANRFL